MKAAMAMRLAVTPVREGVTSRYGGSRVGGQRYGWGDVRNDPEVEGKEVGGQHGNA